MSTFNRLTKHPITRRWELATWYDDYFGNHHYGVVFLDGTVYDPWEKPLITDINAEEADVLNKEMYS